MNEVAERSAALARALVTGLGIGAAGLAYYSLRVEPLRIERTEPDLCVPGLPVAWNGVRILLLADLHAWRWGERERRVLEALDTAATPDLIVWGGDFLGHRDGLDTALRLAREIHRRYPEAPAFAIWGNAEHKIPQQRRDYLRDGLADAGVQTLENAWTTLTLRGETVTVAGTDDPYYGFCDLEAALEGAPTDRFLLLLAHSPQIATQAARAGAGLMLCGHTHGGQVRVPGYGALKTQNPLSRRIDCGAFDRRRLTQVLGRDPGGDTLVYITRGIGLAFVPRMRWAAPRFNCRPEVALMTLRAGTGG
jgi:uncharacterized protein